MRCGLIRAERYLELLGAHDHHGAARAGPPDAKRGGIELRCVDQVSTGRTRTRPTRSSATTRKGALVACALDLTLRREGRASLDDLMRALWERYGQRGIGVPEDGIPALASELAGRDLSDFFARYVDGTEDPPLRELLAEFGVTLHLRAANDAKDRGGKPAKDRAPAVHARRARRRAT